MVTVMEETVQARSGLGRRQNEDFSFKRDKGTLSSCKVTDEYCLVSRKESGPLGI